MEERWTPARRWERSPALTSRPQRDEPGQLALSRKRSGLPICLSQALLA